MPWFRARRDKALQVPPMTRGDLGHSRATSVFACGGEQQYVTVEWGRTVRRRSWPSGAVVDEADCPATRSGCAIEEVAASPAGRWIVTLRSSGQGEWGYDVLRSCPLAREAGTPEEGGFMLDLPRFSEDEARLVGGFGPRWLGGWWSHPDGDFDEPSPGGPISFGFLLVHRLPGHEVGRHGLRFDLPEGWVPDDPAAETWSGAREIAPTADGIRLTLPGGIPFELEGRLPPVVLLPTPHPSGGRLL